MAAPPPPSQGQTAWTPIPAPTAYVNNNNNYAAPALPGALANPTPGTIVIHVNGRVEIDAWGTWSSADSRLVAVPGAPAGTPLSSVKVEPQAIASYARLYFGADGMATNGLRYGAAIELRQNFFGQPSSAASSGASGYTSTETMFVRRAFTYVAGANWGIVRVGQADGIIGIFDNGVTTFQFMTTGNLNGGDLEAGALGSRRCRSGSLDRPATSMATTSSSTSRRRLPASTSASSTRRTRRTATPSAVPRAAGSPPASRSARQRPVPRRPERLVPARA